MDEKRPRLCTTQPTEKNPEPAAQCVYLSVPMEPRREDSASTGLRLIPETEDDILCPRKVIVLLSELQLAKQVA